MVASKQAGSSSSSDSASSESIHSDNPGPHQRLQPETRKVESSRRRLICRNCQVEDRGKSGTNVQIPIGDGFVPAIFYEPHPDSVVMGLVVAAPGSNGGCGPGLESAKAGLPLACHCSRSAYGSIYRRLGLELSTGQQFDWTGQEFGTSTSSRTTGDRLQRSSKGGSGRRNNSCASRACPTMAVLQMSWRPTADGSRWPGGKLKRVSALRDAAEDMEVAARWLMCRFAGRARNGLAPPLFLIGFSFGGPSAWAAGASLLKNGVSPTAIVAMAGSARGGSAFEDESLDTVRCMGICANAGVRMLLMHGTADKNVLLPVAYHCFQECFDAINSKNDTAANVSAALVVFAGSSHMFSVARNSAYTVLTAWIQSVAISPRVGIDPHQPPDGEIPTKVGGKRVLDTGNNSGLGIFATPWLPHLVTYPVAVILRGNGQTLRTEPLMVTKVSREELLRARTKGYSEKSTNPE